MKLTCVTAVFNAVKSGNGKNLVSCIESVAALTVEHEHLIYDGASTDGTVEILRELAKRIPTLKIMSEKDTGIYNALNKGVRDAKGEWFYVLGCDDYLCAPDVMDRLLTEVSSNVDVIVAPVERNRQNVFFKRLEDLSIIFWTVPYSHQGMLMKTERVREFGGFDENKYHICADWDMMHKAHESALHFQYTYKPFAFYKAGGLSESDNNCWKEVTAVIQRHLGMNDWQTQVFRCVGFPPLRIMLSYLFHKDLAYRLGARAMVRKWFAYYAGRIVHLPERIYRKMRRLN